MDHAIISWLLESPLWLQARVQADLLAQRQMGDDLTRRSAAEDPAIRAIIQRLQNFPAEPIISHKSAGHALHQLVFLADLGITHADAGIPVIIDNILRTAAPQGPMRMPTNITEPHSGGNKEQLGWALCDTPLLLYALARFGLGEHPAVQKAAAYLAGLAHENGWHCVVSLELGNWRGPGRKDDPCPYANLIMLKALAYVPGCTAHPAVRNGVETALTLWEARRERHPYMFFMGTDFCKLKAPLVWYDILNVLDVLTHFDWALDDPRLHHMAAHVQAKADPQGRYTPESVWSAWKDWEFAQKKIPSRWVTFLVMRIQQRMASR